MFHKYKRPLLTAGKGSMQHAAAVTAATEPACEVLCETPVQSLAMTWNIFTTIALQNVS